MSLEDAAERDELSQKDEHLEASDSQRQKVERAGSLGRGRHLGGWRAMETRCQLGETQTFWGRLGAMVAQHREVLDAPELCTSWLKW